MNDDSVGSPRTGASPHVQVGAQIGSYRIEAFVDRGGMASVFEATDLRLNRRVALKVLAQELNDGGDFRERFVRESRFAASLDHPNIVPIYDAGEADGFLYIAMRYVRGSNLATLIRENGPLDPHLAIAILTPVADALDTAHAAGLVHRDVKPANILLSLKPGPERLQHVYLTDFGLTKRTSALTKLTATGHFIGTMAYISPEQIRGEPLDSLADLYALACVAYECLTGVPPFVRDDQAALLWAHLSDDPVAVSHYRSDLRGMDPVLARALAKTPGDRYQTCEHFTHELSEALLTGRHRPAPTGASVPAATRTEPNHRNPSIAGYRKANDDETTRAAQVPTASASGRQSPSMTNDSTSTGNRSGGPGPTAASPVDVPAGTRRRRVRTVATVSAIAAAPVVATILTVIVVVRSSSENNSASGFPTGSSASSAASSAADVSGAAVPPATSASLAEVPPSVTVAVTPVAALAIPSIDGQPITVGSTPGYVGITPNGLQAFIANRAAGIVTVVDTTIDQVSAQITMSAGPPQYIAFTPDGTAAYVSIFNPEETINMVAVLDTRTTRVIKTVPVDKKPVALAVSPDQRFVYVPSHDAGAIDVIDVDSGTRTQSIPVSANPHWVRFSPDGKLAYIANHESNIVSVMDTTTNEISKTIGVGTSPHSIAVSPDGTQVAVVCFDSNDTYFIDTASNEVVGRVEVGSNPQDITYSPDGRFVYTADVDSNTVSVIDTQTRTVTARIPTSSPTSVAVTPDGRKAYVTNLDSGTLTVLKTGS